jgi:hypothetical protein
MKSRLLLISGFVFSILIMGCDSEQKDNNLTQASVEVDVKSLSEKAYDDTERFGNIEKDSILMRKLVSAIGEHYINEALNDGYTLSIEDDYFSCECKYINGAWMDAKTKTSCSHDLARTRLYFPPQYKIIYKDINNDGINDYIINYSIEGFYGGNMHVNYNGTILGGQTYNYIHTEVWPDTRLD